MRKGNKGKASAYHKEYRRDNKDRISETQKAYRIDNKDKAATYSKEYRRINRVSISAKKKIYRDNNIEKIKLYLKSRRADINAKDRKRYARLTDAQVRKLVCGHSTLSAKDIPQSLIEAKRLEIQMKRFIRETENG